MMYMNTGMIQGRLASRPMIVEENIVLIRVKVVEPFINKKTQRRKVNYISAYAYGKIAQNIKNANLERGQEISLSYIIQTNKKEIQGEVKYFQDLTVTKIKFGSKLPTKSEDVETEVTKVEVQPEEAKGRNTSALEDIIKRTEQI